MPDARRDMIASERRVIRLNLSLGGVGQNLEAAAR